MGAEYRDRQRRYFRQILDEDGALVLQAFDHVFVVDDLVPDIDRRAVFLERALDDLDRAHDARAKATRLRQINFHGMPVTQLHQNYSLRSGQPGSRSGPPDLQYPHHARRLASAPSKPMAGQGFVAKNDGLEKASRNTIA